MISFKMSKLTKLNYVLLFFIKENLVKAIIFILFSTNLCFAQNSKFISISQSFWASRTFTEVGIKKINKNGFGIGTYVAFGQFGKRIFDNKTKDFFGNVYTPYNSSLIKTSNVGAFLKLEGNYSFDFNKHFSIIPSAYISTIFYKHYLYRAITNDYTPPQTFLFTTNKLTFNIILGYSTLFQFKINKKLSTNFGFSLQFYTRNQFEYDIQKNYDPLMVGLEPVINFGLNYKIK